MSRLIVLAEPRSCSSYFTNQFTRSPLLYVCPKAHHELITPNRRECTREYLGLPPISDPQSWSRDIPYTIEFLRKHEHASFKCIVSGHGESYIHFLKQLPNTTFVTLRRVNEADSIASMLSRLALKILRPDEEVWTYSSKADPIRFGDVGTILNQPSIHKYVDILYWNVINKSKLVMNSFADAHNITTEELHIGFHHRLEDDFQMEFDFSDYREPSHYSEIFTDWKHYENTIRETVGPISGLG